MAAIKQRHRTWWAKLRVPQELRSEYGGRAQLEVSLKTGDARQARELAAIWEGRMREEFREKAGRVAADEPTLRRLYERMRERAEAGAFHAEDRRERSGRHLLSRGPHRRGHRLRT